MQQIALGTVRSLTNRTTGIGADQFITSFGHVGLNRVNGLTGSNSSSFQVQQTWPVILPCSFNYNFSKNSDKTETFIALWLLRRLLLFQLEPRDLRK